MVQRCVFIVSRVLRWEITITTTRSPTRFTSGAEPDVDGEVGAEFSAAMRVQ